MSQAHQGRKWIAGSTLVTVLGAAISLTAILGAAEARSVTAYASRTLNVTETAHMHQNKRPGSSFIVEEGHVTGTLPGTVRAYITLGATVMATVKIYTSGGTITGHGSGELKGRPSEPSFGGHLTITSGTGRYAHAHGAGGLYGVLIRKTLSVTVSATGKISY